MYTSPFAGPKPVRGLATDSRHWRKFCSCSLYINRVKLSRYFMYIIKFNIQKFYVLPAACIYVLYWSLNIHRSFPCKYCLDFIIEKESSYWRYKIILQKYNLRWVFLNPERLKSGSSRHQESEWTFLEFRHIRQLFIKVAKEDFEYRYETND